MRLLIALVSGLSALLSQGVGLQGAPIFSDRLALRSTADRGKPFAQMAKINSAGLGGGPIDDILINEDEEPGGRGLTFMFAVTAGREVYVTLQDQPGNKPDVRLHPALVAYMIEPAACPGGCPPENEPPGAGQVSDKVTLDAKKVGEFFVFDLSFWSDPASLTMPAGTPAANQVLEDGTVQDITAALYAGTGIAAGNVPFLVLAQSCSFPCGEIPEPGTAGPAGLGLGLGAWLTARWLRRKS